MEKAQKAGAGSQLAANAKAMSTVCQVCRASFMCTLAPIKLKEHSDNGIVVHRNRDEKLGSLREVTINVQKVRNKVAGSIGDPKLEYNVSNGRYVDI